MTPLNLADTFLLYIYIFFIFFIFFIRYIYFPILILATFLLY